MGVALFYKVSVIEYIQRVLMLYPNLDNKTLAESYDNIVLPSRKTACSAGYDFICPINIIIKPNESAIIPTGIKCKMRDDYFLAIYIRSSLGIKYDITLKNTVGIIDSDYYGNEDNEGHILVALKNNSNKDFEINAGTRIVQGIITPYERTIDDCSCETRKGGIGSTDNE